MILRDYQSKIIEEVLENFKTLPRQLIVVPTGGGKTVIFSSIVARLGLKTLVLAHTNELVEQATKTLRQIAPRVFWEVMTIQKASIQSNKESLAKEGFGLIIVDECHRIAAPSYQGLINLCPQAKLLGVTATPYRGDGSRISDLLALPVESVSLIEMIKDGYLCDFEGYRVATTTSLKGISTKSGDFVTSRLEPVINVKNRNELIVREYQKIAPGEKALCFAVNIKHAYELMRSFNQEGIVAAAIHGNLGTGASIIKHGHIQTKDARKRLLREFKEGRIQVMVNCQVLTEGYDEPSIKCLLMARPTMSKLLYTQMIGRGSRTFPGKEKCKVIEFTDNNYDVCNLGSLLDAKMNKFNLNFGERLTSFKERCEKELLDQRQETVVEKIDITPISIMEKLASEWQKEFLKSLAIEFSDQLTEFQANKLIRKVTNG